MWWGFVVLLVLALGLQRAWQYLYDTQFTWRGLLFLLLPFALWIAVWIADGWAWALLAVGGSFALGGILDALMPRVLGPWLRRRAERWSLQEKERFSRLLEQESSAGFYEKLEDHHLENAQRCNAALAMASIDADVSKALSRHEKHTEDLTALYFDKHLKDLPPWHRERAVRNPRTVDYYFGTAVDLPADQPSTVLRAWLMERPAGDLPARLHPERVTEETLAARTRLPST